MIGDLAQQLRLRENQIFLAVTILIGVLAGLAAVLFTLAIEIFNYRLFGMSPSAIRLLLGPALVGVVTGILLAKFFPNVRGSGVPQTEAAYHLNQGVMPIRIAFGKFITGVLCVGSGHSMGREGPSVQIGAALASTLGRWLRLSPARVQSLVPIGAAAALAAAFNTPVAAVLFALEEIVSDLNAGTIGPVVVASVTSVIVERSLLGSQPLFRVPQYHLVQTSELLAYAALGIIGGIISLIFCKGLLWARTMFRKLPGSTVMFQPAMGGLMIGALLIVFPEVMGVGYEYVDQALNGGLVLKAMILLCAAKLVGTIISYASGNAGGIFAPSLYLGAMAGGAVGSVVHRLAPLSTGDPGAYALVGMGALFAGIIRAPMTSVFMIFELTQDYQILVPLMVANMLSFIISKRYQEKPIYHALLEQDGIYLPGPESRFSASGARARDIMMQDFFVVSSGVPVEDVWKKVENNSEKPVVIGSREIPAGILQRGEIEKAVRAGKGKEPVISLAVRTRSSHVYSDHPLDVALERLVQTAGALPVLSRRGHILEGVITRETVMRFLNRESLAKAGVNVTSTPRLSGEGQEL
ncbi:MAG: chloride channel protein [Candidatus Angelobacter sp.]